MDTETTYLPTKKVLQRYGVTAMTLWRWERDAALPFPKPLIINDRKFYALDQVEAWERAQAAAAALKKAAKNAAAA